MKSKQKLRLPLALLSLGLLASPVMAQNALERFFFGSNGAGHFPPAPKPRATAPRAVPAPAPAPAPKKIVRISGPSYYSYKTDALQKLDFAPVTTASVDAGEGVAASGLGAALGEIDVQVEQEIAAALQEFYASEAEPVWLEDGRPNARAVEVLRVLGEADRFGLDPADYALSLPAGEMRHGGPDAREAMRFEMAMSARVLRYVLDARNGRVVPDRLSGYHDLPRKEIDLVAVLETLARLSDMRTYLESRHPQNGEYRALRRELELLRASPEEDTVELDRTALIRPGGSHADFPLILGLIERETDEAFREEWGGLIAAGRTGEQYRMELVPAIKAVQKKLGLSADGVIGPRTIAALAGETRAVKLDKVLLGLERLRWLPSELGDPHVFINAAGFRVTYRENGSDRLSMRAIVGTKANQTYFFQDKIQRVEFNPYWGVPQSILVNEMLPRLQRDPSWLDRSGYEVFASGGRQVSSASVNWWQYNGRVPFDVRQKPGPSNALGELKIMFPNSHAIYMHDTPDRSLFGRDMRAFSHGCVRLEDPRAMAAAVLGWDESEIASRLGRGHSAERVTADIPVYIAYFTAWPDAEGRISYHDDIYERDSHLRKAMEMTSKMRQAGS